MNLNLYVHAFKFTTCVKTLLTLKFQQKLTCTLKGVTPLKWLLIEGVSSSTIIGSHERVWVKLSIILFLCYVRASSSNNLIRSPTSSLFSSPGMWGCSGQWEWLSPSSISSRPNSYTHIWLETCIEKEKE